MEMTSSSSSSQELDLVLAALLEQGVELRGDVDPAHRPGHVGEQRLQLGGVEDPARPRVLDDVGDVAGREPGVDGDEDSAGLGDAEVGEQQRLAVEGEEGDTIVLPQPGAAQRRGEPPRAPPPLRIGVPAVTVDGGEPLAVDGAGAFEEGDGRELVAEDALSPAALGDHATTLIRGSRRMTGAKHHQVPPRTPGVRGGMWGREGQLLSALAGVIASTRRTA